MESGMKVARKRIAKKTAKTKKPAKKAAAKKAAAKKAAPRRTAPAKSPSSNGEPITWNFKLIGHHLLDGFGGRSEEHTSELQSLRHLVCRLLLEKKKQN